MAEDGLVVGIDTHLDVHVAAVLDRLGRSLAVHSFPATDAGNAQLIRWLGGLGTVAGAGVEGSGSYGYRLARALTRHGVRVREVNCPDRSRRRRRGKSDPVDAENAARAMLAGEAAAVPKDRDEVIGELRLLVITRRSAVKAPSAGPDQDQPYSRLHAFRGIPHHPGAAAKGPASGTGSMPVNADVASNWIQNATGHHFSFDQLFSQAIAGNSGAIPSPQRFTAWLAQHHYSQWVSYRPDSWFWHFQTTEAASYAILATLLALATVLLLRRRAV